MTEMSGAPGDASDDWPYEVGQVIKRSTLHDRFGGSRQSGISPCRMSPNVLIFTDQASGSPHGYVFDGWVDDGDDKVFLYTGEGQRGDQQLIRGNAAILNHQQEGRALRLFEGAGGSNVRYVGRFVIDEKHPYTEREAPDTGGATLRQTAHKFPNPGGLIPDLVIKTTIHDENRWLLVEVKGGERRSVADSARAAVRDLFGYRRAFSVALDRQTEPYGLGYAWGEGLNSSVQSDVTLCTPDILGDALAMLIPRS